MRSTTWMVLSIVFLFITVLGVFFTGNQVLGAIGTLGIVFCLWFTFRRIDLENDNDSKVL
ncbi:MAG: hypothetical protein ACMUIE_09835 [Thermoplasmatota archaeon]